MSGVPENAGTALFFSQIGHRVGKIPSWRGRENLFVSRQHRSAMALRCHIVGCKMTNLWQPCARSGCSSATGWSSCTGTWCARHPCLAHPIQRGQGRPAGKRKRSEDAERVQHNGERAEEMAGAQSSASITLRRSQHEINLSNEVARLGRRVQSLEDDFQSATDELQDLRAEMERERERERERKEWRRRRGSEWRPRRERRRSGNSSAKN